MRPPKMESSNPQFLFNFVSISAEYRIMKELVGHYNPFKRPVRDVNDRLLFNDDEQLKGCKGYDLQSYYIIFSEVLPLVDAKERSYNSRIVHPNRIEIIFAIHAPKRNKITDGTVS